MLTSQNRTVSLRRARIIAVACAACSLTCLAAVLASLAISGLTAWLVPGLLGCVLMALRARRWIVALRAARTPDEYRWTPGDQAR